MKWEGESQESVKEGSLHPLRANPVLQGGQGRAVERKNLLLPPVENSSGRAQRQISAQGCEMLPLGIPPDLLLFSFIDLIPLLI